MSGKRGSTLKYFICLLSVFSFLTGCSDDSPSLACGAGGEIHREMTDAGGDTSFSFLDIGDVKVSVFEQRIEVVISLLEVPDLFTVDADTLILEDKAASDTIGEATEETVGTTEESTETPEKIPALEYSWQVSFDTSCSGNSNADVRLALTNFKFGHESEGEDALLDFTAAQVWQVDASDKLYKVTDDIVTATLEDNVLTLSVVKESDVLKAIQASTPVRIITSYNEAGQTYYDSYPDGYPDTESFYTTAEALAAQEELDAEQVVENNDEAASAAQIIQP